jgi:hypothetical protein
MINMAAKDEIKQVYLDTNLLREWFARLMRKETREDPRIIKFLREHDEIKKFVSIFTIAELVESLLFHETRIRDHMKEVKVIGSFAQVLMETTGIKVIELEKEDDHRGIFVSPNVVKYTGICGSLKDAIHVCIAEHEDLWLITHDDKIGKLNSIYRKITTDTHLMKLFEK